MGLFFNARGWLRTKSRISGLKRELKNRDKYIDQLLNEIECLRKEVKFYRDAALFR